jgi:hypothetical protein
MCAYNTNYLRTIVSQSTEVWITAMIYFFMNMKSPRAISLLFLLLSLGVSSFLYYPRYAQQKAMTAQLGALLSQESDASPLSPRSKSAGCTLENASPDSACTPGAVFADISLDRMCTPGYTKTVRNVPEKLRLMVYAEYGVPYPQPHGFYEVDHLIPLAIGGDNDIANLFPQPAEPAPGFREKDLVELYLRGEVCAGRVALPIAQEQIAHDWLAIYEALPPQTIASLKAAYRNWSN